MNTPLDSYEIIMPIAMRSYLRNFGFGFNKKACEFAVSLMRKSGGEKVEFKDKEQVYEILKKYGIKLEHDNGYNATYIWHQGYADLLKSSVPDEQRLAMYVKDMIEDPDLLGSNCFRQWLSNMDAKGIIVEWDELL